MLGNAQFAIGCCKAMTQQDMLKSKTAALCVPLCSCMCSQRTLLGCEELGEQMQILSPGPRVSRGSSFLKACRISVSEKRTLAIGPLSPESIGPGPSGPLVIPLFSCVQWGPSWGFEGYIKLQMGFKDNVTGLQGERMFSNWQNRNNKSGG